VIEPTLALAVLDDPIELARAMMAFYKDAMLQRKIQDQMGMAFCFGLIDRIKSTF